MVTSLRNASPLVLIFPIVQVTDLSEDFNSGNYDLHARDTRPIGAKDEIMRGFYFKGDINISRKPTSEINRELAWVAWP